MKHFSTLALAIYLSLMASIPAVSYAARETSHNVMMQEKPVKIPDQPLDPGGRRSAPKPIICVISTNGINIAGYDTSLIYLYEVRDENGEVTAAFGTEQDFLTYLFNSEDVSEIRLYIKDFFLQGYL